jgi:hypothetical protein
VPAVVTGWMKMAVTPALMALRAFHSFAVSSVKLAVRKSADKASEENEDAEVQVNQVAWPAYPRWQRLRPQHTLASGRHKLIGLLGGQRLGRDPVVRRARDGEAKRQSSGARAGSEKGDLQAVVVRVFAVRGSGTVCKQPGPQALRRLCGSRQT